MTIVAGAAIALGSALVTAGLVWYRRLLRQLPNHNKDMTLF